jgi:hypothetical protein
VLLVLQCPACAANITHFRKYNTFCFKSTTKDYVESHFYKQKKPTFIKSNIVQEWADSFLKFHDFIYLSIYLSTKYITQLTSGLHFITSSGHLKTLSNSIL